MVRIKKKKEEKDNSKVLRLPISRLIDTKFRDYALYVLTSRGIPSFYDALTPVQRYILMNSPLAFNKTLSVVGRSIEDGYHHGDMSLAKAIAKLARPFGASLQILEGYGFFGTEVSPEPAAARYTSIRLGKKPGEILKKYKYLFTREEEGAHHPFWMDLPLGLTSPIVGIAVGYKTTILPRKLEHIKEYLEGKRKSVNPYFQDFKGTVKKFNNIDKSWIISSNITVNDRTIEVRELPPVMKYTSVLKKIDWIFTKFEGRVRVVNNSNTKVNLDLKYNGKDEKEWEEVQAYIKKIFSVIVTETPVFVKDGQVLVYDKIEQYLDDYKWQILRLDAKNKEYQRDWSTIELGFNEYKKLFIEFILKTKRSVAEIDEFLKGKPKDMKIRLEGLTAKKFTTDELAKTVIRIKELKKELKLQETAYAKSQKLLDKTPDPTLARGISSKKSEPTNLFDDGDIPEIDGIAVWDGEDPFEKSLLAEGTLE